VRTITQRRKDMIGGAMTCALGLGVAAVGPTYKLGTLTNMGAGFFPTALGCILALTGLAIAGSAWMSARTAEGEAVLPEWRGWACIIGGIIAFVVLGSQFGLLPATFAIVLISALGDRQNTLRESLLLAAAIVVVCVLVFWWALRIQLPLLSWPWS